MIEKENKTAVLLKAISFAARVHRHQLRKDKVTPFASHPFRVSMVLRHVFKVEDEDALAAAVLHDTIEDTTTDWDDLSKHFGDKIAGWVALLSKDKRMEETAREAGYIRQLKSAPLVVKLIKLADIYDNLNDISNIPPEDRSAKTLKQIATYAAALKDETREYVKPHREIERLIRSAKA